MVVYALSINGIAQVGIIYRECKGSMVEASCVGRNGRVMLNSDARRIVTREEEESTKQCQINE